MNVNAKKRIEVKKFKAIEKLGIDKPKSKEENIQRAKDAHVPAELRAVAKDREPKLDEGLSPVLEK